jgi:hypothetical protein
MSNMTTGPEQEKFAEWTDSEDWCSLCGKLYVKLEYDDKTRTTKCPHCGHTESYSEDEWKSLQAQRHVYYQYTPGKYYFRDLTVEDVFRKYIRELNHEDWCSWLIHDYVLARMRGDKAVQDRMREAAKLAVEKMSYDRKPWDKLFEKMDATDAEIFMQVPQIIYEMTEKKFREVTNEGNTLDAHGSYVTALTSMYSYNRWKGDRVACWVVREVIKICVEETGDSAKFYSDCYDSDPFLDSFERDILAGTKRKFNLRETYVEWQLGLAEKFLQQSNALVAIWDAYYALTAKLGIHAIWPPTKIIEFGRQSIESVAKAVGNMELLELYNYAIDLNSIDEKKACWYAKNFIEKVKELLPKVQIADQDSEAEKSLAYVS